MAEHKDNSATTATGVKTCFKCNAEKPIAEFYKHPQMAHKILGKCKECTRADVQANRRKRVEYYRQYDKIRQQRPERYEKKREYYARYIQRYPGIKAETIRRYEEHYPEKRTAHIAARNAIRDKRLLKQPCEVCGEPKTEAHHDDYSKPLEVRWLCKKHHMEHHWGAPPVAIDKSVRTPF